MGVDTHAQRAEMACDNDSSEFSEGVTIHEIMLNFVITNVPVKITLIDTISEGITEAIDDSIQARFGGIGLPTTVKDLDKLLTNDGNLVTVKVYVRVATVLIVDYLSVGRLPIDAVSNRLIHLLFDLPHGRSVCLN